MTRHLIQAQTPSRTWFCHEDALCADLDAALDHAAEILADWPDFRAIAMPTDRPAYDATAEVKTALAARYEADGYAFDTIPTALVDYASDELQAAHAADQADQLGADIWRECAA